MPCGSIRMFTFDARWNGIVSLQWENLVTRPRDRSSMSDELCKPLIVEKSATVCLTSILFYWWRARRSHCKESCQRFFSSFGFMNESRERRGIEQCFQRDSSSYSHPVTAPEARHKENTMNSISAAQFALVSKFQNASLTNINLPQTVFFTAQTEGLRSKILGRYARVASHRLMQPKLLHVNVRHTKFVNWGKLFFCK